MSHQGRYALLFGFWGDGYAEDFLRYSLGSLLFPHNLPLVSDYCDIAIKIATTKPCRRILEADARFKEVCRDYQVQIVTIPVAHTRRSARRDHKYTVWASLLNRLMRLAAAESRSFLFFHSDSFYPDGFLELVVERARAGMKVVYSPGIRIDAAKMRATFPDMDRPIPPIAGQAYEAMTIANLHEFVLRQYWQSDRLSYWPAALLFRLDDHFTIGRCFDIHPVLVDLSVGNFPIKLNVDADYDIEVMAKMLANGEGDRIEVLSCENSHFGSITEPDEAWPARLTLVGDDATAPLVQYNFPRTDSEKFLHLARWAGKYVPLKKILFFQALYVFRTKPGDGSLPKQKTFEFGLLCDALLNYFPLLQDEDGPKFSLDLPTLDVRIEI